MGFEDLIEKFRIGIADQLGDLRHLFGGIGKEPAAFPDPDLLKIALEGLPGLLLE